MLKQYLKQSKDKKMHQLKNGISFILLGLVLFACDNRWVFRGENFPPEIGLKFSNGQFTDEEGNLLEILSDTFKLNSKSTSEVYTFDMKYFDDNLIEISYEILKGEGRLIQINGGETEAGKLDISEEEISLEYEPFDLGEHEIRFVGIDDFEEQSNAIDINLFFFDNWLPVGQLDVSYVGKTNERHYLFNAETSYDEDAAYGGAVVQYKYLINEEEILTTVSSINYIFQAPGTYTVGLQVLDNDNIWSEVITQEVEVE